MFFFFNDTATTEIYTLSLHDALPIWNIYPFHFSDGDNYYSDNDEVVRLADELISTCNLFGYGEIGEDRKSTRLNSSHANISYAVFCLKKNNISNSETYNFTLISTIIF